MKQTILSSLTPCWKLSCRLATLSFSLAVFNLPAFTYTNFNSTNGLNLVGVTAVVGGALRLTPEADSVVGAAWAVAKQPCASGFETSFQFRISNPGARPGTPLGADGIIFTLQNIGPTDPNVYNLGSPADGNISVIFNTFWNWPDSTDFTKWDVSANSVGVLSNGLYLAQTDLTPRAIHLKDGAPHNARIAFDGTGLTVWLDGVMVLTNVSVPGVASAVDTAGNAWVGFGANTGWAWEDHDILNWSFLSPSSNRAPAALCADAIVSAGTNCQADASVNNGSFDPDGDPITVSQIPPGPYPVGTNRVTLIVTDDKGVSNSCNALVIVLNNLQAFTYTNFNSTAGLNLLGVATAVGGALQLTPAADSVNGEAWTLAKQPCAGGFDTTFQFRIANPGSRPGTPPGSDGVIFTIQNIGATNATLYDLGSPADGSVSVIFNTWRNWAGCSDYIHCDVSDNSVGVLSNGLYLAQANLTPRGINLKDGAAHNARIAFDGTGLTVWLDGAAVLTNIPVPGLASAVDAAGKAWVGFGAGTGWAWETHDVLSWSFLGSLSNRAPVALCADVIVSAGTTCQADASVNHGSFDPDGDPITISQVPAGPYPVGTNLVTMTATDNHCASSACSALVIVQDQTPPVLVCAPNQQVEFQDETGAVASYVVTASDTCSAVSLVVRPASGSRFPIGITPVKALAVDAYGSSNQCAFTVTVLGAWGVKSNVLAQLVGLRIAATNQVDCWKLSEAIEDMIDALGLDVPTAPRWVLAAHRRELCERHHHHPNGPLWLDETHVDRKRGGWVFAQEQDAVQELAELIRNQRSSIPLATLHDLIDRLVRCDRLLAVVSIEDAVRAGANTNRIARALREVALGDGAAASDHAGLAVQHYWKAWTSVGRLGALGIASAAGGGMQLGFAANEAGRMYVIQASTNLVDWVVVGTLAADANGNVSFTDPDAAKYPNRFYRAVRQ